jgi:hypothetical protein
MVVFSIKYLGLPLSDTLDTTRREKAAMMESGVIVD